MDKYELDVRVQINKLNPDGYRSNEYIAANYMGTVKAADFMAAISVLAQFEKLTETFKAQE